MTNHDSRDVDSRSRIRPAAPSSACSPTAPTRRRPSATSRPPGSAMTRSAWRCRTGTSSADLLDGNHRPRGGRWRGRRRGERWPGRRSHRPARLAADSRRRPDRGRRRARLDAHRRRDRRRHRRHHRRARGPRRAGGGCAALRRRAPLGRHPRDGRCRRRAPPKRWSILDRHGMDFGPSGASRLDSPRSRRRSPGGRRAHPTIRIAGRHRRTTERRTVAVESAPRTLRWPRAAALDRRRLSRSRARGLARTSRAGGGRMALSPVVLADYRVPRKEPREGRSAFMPIGGAEVLQVEEVRGPARRAPARRCSGSRRSASTSSRSITAPACTRCPLPFTLGTRGGRHGRGRRARSHDRPARRPRGLGQRARRLRRVCAGAGGSAGAAARPGEHPAGRGRDAAGHDRPLSHHLDLPARSGPDLPGARRGRRRRPAALPDGQACAAPG